MLLKNYILPLACSALTALAAADSAKIESLQIDVPGHSGSLHFHGKDMRDQILVTAKNSNGSLEDVTHKAKFDISPSGIVEIKDGLITPLRNGEATITASINDGTHT